MTEAVHEQAKRSAPRGALVRQVKRPWREEVESAQRLHGTRSGGTPYGSFSVHLGKCTGRYARARVLRRNQWVAHSCFIWCQMSGIGRFLLLSLNDEVDRKLLVRTAQISVATRTGGRAVHMKRLASTGKTLNNISQLAGDLLSVAVISHKLLWDQGETYRLGATAGNRFAH